MKKILHTIQEGGSGTGIHYYESILRCPMRHYLNERFQDETGIQKDTSDDAQIGFIFHELLALYFGKKVDRGTDTNLIEYRHASGDPANFNERCRIEAERIFRAYRARFPQNIYGRVLGNEVPFEVENVEWLPPDLPLTARLDMIARVSQASSKLLREKRGISIFPGRYLVDYKTKKSANPIGFARERASLQWTAYQKIYEECTGVRLDGVLIDVIVRTSQPSFYMLFVPPPDEDAVNVLYHQLNWAKQLYIDNKLQPCFTTACFDFNKICPWFDNGCRRY